MSVALFADLPEDDVRRLMAAGRLRRFDRGQVVFYRDDPADTLHLVQVGRFVAEITTPHGETAALSVVGPGEWFGELALLGDHRRRSATVLALEKARTLSIHQADFDRIRRHYPTVSQVLNVILAEQVRRLSDHLVEALYVPVDERVRRRLRALVDLYRTDEETGTVTVPLTQDVIAGLAGTSRATVNRVLREDEQRGVLSLARGKVTVMAELPAGR